MASMTRSALLTSGAAACAAATFPSLAFAAVPTVKVGYIDSFSGVFSDIGERQKRGIELALAEANKSGRVRYELVTADDKSKPADGSTEARRLLDDVKIDVLLFGTSSAISLAISPLTLAAGVFQLSINPNDTSITGKNASKNTYRFSPTSRMIIPAVAQHALARGKNWYFLVSDYAFGHDGYQRASTALKNAGGSEAGMDLFPLGTKDYSSYMTKVRNSKADVVFICSGGLDVAEILKTFVSFGLQSKMHVAGLSLEDTYDKVLPLDQLGGSTFGILWAPSVSDSAQRLARKLEKAIPGRLTSRYYMGYMCASQLVERMNAVGTTRCDDLVKAFADHRFDAARARPATWRGCDHQLEGDTYAGAIVSRARLEKTNFMFDVVSDVPGPSALGSCSQPDAAAAIANMSKQTIGNRSPVALR
jgi:branched-chain amino acid transport system substrate-binding protein